MTDEQARTLRERLEQIARTPSRIGYELEAVKYQDLTIEAARATLNAVEAELELELPHVEMKWARTAIRRVRERLTAPAEGAATDLARQQEVEARDILASQHATFDSENAAAETRIRSSAPAEGVASFPQEKEQKHENAVQRVSPSCDCDRTSPAPYNATFLNDLAAVLNRYSMENGSDTPDFILAEYLAGCLANWNTYSRTRESWYGIDRRGPTIAAPARPPEADTP